MIGFAGFISVTSLSKAIRHRWRLIGKHHALLRAVTQHHKNVATRYS